MIKTLGNTASRFLDQNNRIYYNCLGNGSVTSVQSGSVVVYIVNGARLPDYLLGAYNYKGGVGISNSLRL